MPMTVPILNQSRKYRTIDSGTEFRYKQRRPGTAQHQASLTARREALAVVAESFDYVQQTASGASWLPREVRIADGPWNVRGLPSTSLRTLAMQAATAARALGCWGTSASVTARAAGCTDHLTFRAPQVIGRHVSLRHRLRGPPAASHRPGWRRRELRLLLPPAVRRPHRRPAHRPRTFPMAAQGVPLG